MRTAAMILLFGGVFIPMPQVPFSVPFIQLLLWFERWVLAGLSLFFGWDHLLTLRLLQLVRTSRACLPGTLAAADAGLATGVDFADVARYGLMAMANFLVALFLVCNRRPVCPPRRVVEILVPLAGTYCTVLLNVPALFPAWMTTPLVPSLWEVPLASFGLGICALGGVVSLVGILWLGRSLGIFVSVREVVLAGPYRWVRHPIYAGYALSLVGFSFTGCTLRLAVMVTLSIGLLVWRARLEEAALQEDSPAYRRVQAVAGFFLPRLGLNRWSPNRPSLEEQTQPGDLAHARAFVPEPSLGPCVPGDLPRQCAPFPWPLPPLPSSSRAPSRSIR